MEVEDEEIKLEFLVTGSYNALPQSYLKLRSYLNIHSSNLAKLHGLKLPQIFTKTNLSCLQCFLPWSCETCSLKLLPVKKLKKRVSKTKVDSSKAVSGLEVPKNHLVLKCKFCNSSSHFYLPKSKKTLKVDVEEEIKVESKKKKKKKKKDKMCGLRKCLDTSLKKSPTRSVSKTKSSTSKSERGANLPTSINRNVQQVNRQPVTQVHIKKNQQTIRSKRTCINPNAAKLEIKTSKKKIKNLQKLQQLVQGEKEPLKKTLKDFLSVI